MPNRPHFDHWFRLGYAARGLVFMGLGLLAWTSGRGAASGDVLERIRALPLGSALLGVMVVALVGLGLFRLAEAWLDLDRRGSEPWGVAQRLGRGFGAFGYVAVAAAALALLADTHHPVMVDPASAARDVRQWSGGGLLLIAAGLGTIGAAGGQAALAWHCRFMETMHDDAPRALRWLGRIGYATRAIVFFLIGWQLVRAGLAGHRIRDVAAVLDAIREHLWIFRLVSGGLFLFGVSSLVEAWYRRMPAEDELKARARASLA